MNARLNIGSDSCSKAAPVFLIFLSAILLFDRVAHSRDPGEGSSEPVPEQTKARNPDFDLTFANALPYSSEAERLGLAVDEAEVGRRMETYRKLYPESEVNRIRVKTILLAEAYAERQAAETGITEPTARFEELKPENFQDNAEFERARRSLQSRDHFGREEVRSAGLKLLNEDNLRTRLSRPPPKEFWPTAELQIPRERTACLAWLEGGCYVTVDEFNGAAGQFQFLRELPLDSARIGVLSKYALAKHAADKGMADNPDMITREMLPRIKKAREFDRSLKMAREFGIPEMNESALRDAYSKYYRRYFRPREDVTLSLIGSSDSTYIDSLHAVLVRWRGDTVLRNGKPIPAEVEPPLPWISLLESDLPPELVAPTDSFWVGDFTAPIRTSYGFFIVRLTQVVPVKGVSFDDAIGKLTYLATRDNFLELDSLAEVKFRQYYDRHPQEFLLPDTLELRAWLAPAPTDSQAKGKPPIRVPPDTLRFRPLRLSSLVLPDPLRIELQNAVRKERRKAFFGPFDGPYGRWHFDVKRVRRAEGRLPYAIARQAIREKISDPPKPYKDTLTSDATQDEVLLKVVAARTFLRDREDAQRLEIDREFEERLRSGAIDTARIPEGEERRNGMQQARITLEEEIWKKNREKEKDFLSAMRIDYRLLN